MRSLHNHTTWSDGQTSVAEMAAEAKRLKLAAFGISDHFTLHPTLVVDWSMPLDRLGDYVADVESHEGVLLGIEADFFPETIDDLRDRLGQFHFNHVIGSVHFVDGFALDSRAEDWSPLTQDDVNDVWRGYWARIAQMAQSGVFTIAGHLDLPKKFGFRPTIDLTAEETRAIEGIADSGMMVEINTNGWNVPAAEQYPSERLLRRIVTFGIPLIISSDAHHPRRIIEGFERAKAVARNAGYTGFR